jgi:hypothetical protein
MRLKHAQISVENNMARLEIDIEGPASGDLNVRLFIDKALFIQVMAEDGRVAGGFFPLYAGTILWLLKVSEVGHIPITIRRYYYGGGVDVSIVDAPVEPDFIRAVRDLVAWFHSQRMRAG